MGEFGIYHWLVVLLILLLLFGGRKIPDLMKGLGEGIRLFKEGISGKGAPGDPMITDQRDRAKHEGTNKS